LAYRNPTLAETYAELHLEPGTLTEARFFDVVPKLKELGFTELELTPAGLSFDFKPGRTGVPMGVPRETQRVRCWKPGRRELAQVGEDLFVVNLTGAYPGWESFTRLFDEGLGALRAGLGEVRVRSLNLLTSDRFQAAKEGFVVSEYLDVGGRIMPRWYADCRESLDLSIGRGWLEADGRNRQVQVSVRALADPVIVQFNAAFHDAVPVGGNLRDTLERLHRESVDTFESLITNRTRNEIMGGVV
jgi:hypothetical protein